MTTLSSSFFSSSVRWISGFGKSRVSNTVFQGYIEDVSAFDLPSIYHHMHTGSLLKLMLTAHQEGGRIGVFFKGFRIGTLPEHQTGLVRKLMQRGFKLQAKVVRTEREKYMAPGEVVVSVTV